MGFYGRASIPGRGVKPFLFPRTILRFSGFSVKWAQEALYWVLKWPSSDADHSPPSRAEVENIGALPLVPRSLFWSCVSYLIKFRGNFKIYL
jgi:hypothetical protein